jgi:hypothetical protein
MPPVAPKMMAEKPFAKFCILESPGSRRKNFFFEKKKQKTFACLASASPETLGFGPGGGAR